MLQFVLASLILMVCAVILVVMTSRMDTRGGREGRRGKSSRSLRGAPVPNLPLESPGPAFPQTPVTQILPKPTQKGTEPFVEQDCSYGSEPKLPNNIYAKVLRPKKRQKSSRCCCCC